SEPVRVYAGLERGIGVIGLASPFVLEHGAAPYALAYAHLKASPGLLTLARFVLGFSFVALPAVLMGGTLPVATRYMVRRSNEVGRGIAQLYPLNTLPAPPAACCCPSSSCRPSACGGRSWPPASSTWASPRLPGAGLAGSTRK